MSLYIEAGYSIADLGGFRLDIVETGGNTFNVQPTGNYFLRTTSAGASGTWLSKVSSYTSLVTALQTALQAGTGSGTYTVSFSTTTNRVTIAHAGGSVTAVSITPTTNGGLIGQTAVKSGALSHEMQRTPDYWINGSVGYWTSNDGRYEGGDDPGVDVESHDGTPHSIAKAGLPEYLDFIVPLEPVAIVGNWPKLVSATTPWTWKSFWQHTRNVWPFVMDDGSEVNFLRQRADSIRFKPLPLVDNYRAHFDMRLLTRVLASK